MTDRTTRTPSDPEAMIPYGVRPSLSAVATAPTPARTMPAGETDQAREGRSSGRGASPTAAALITCSAAIVASGRVEHELIPGTDVPDLRLARGEFEHRTCSLLPGHPPRAQLAPDVQHAEIPVEEQRIDREPHEPGVDGRRRAEQQALPGRELRSAEQPPQARERAIGDRAALAEHAALRVADGDGRAAHRPTPRDPTRTRADPFLKPRRLTTILTVPRRPGRTRILATPFRLVRLRPRAPAPETRTSALRTA